MEGNTSIENNLEIHPSGRNKGPMAIAVDKFSKSFRIMTVRNAKNK